MHTLRLVRSAILGICISGFLFAAVHEAYEDRQQIDALRFSNTQEWDPLVYAQKTVANPLVGKTVFSITLPPPPKNSSNETQVELAYMHELEVDRTTEQLIAIQRELLLESAFFGEYVYRDIVRERPNTEALLTRVLGEISGVIIAQKEYFDRVRPHELDATLHPAIPVPGHPAYPSGHATESMLIALILGDIDPHSAERYRESALRIAHNREIAGVHYPSDSRVGQMLAKQYFELLKGNEEFQLLLTEAKKEW